MVLPAQFKQMPSRLAQSERVARAGLPASLFQTGRLPPAQRFEAWRESVGVFLDVHLPDGQGADNFTATVESYLLDGLILARCTAGRQRFSRPVQKVARDGIDHYMVQLFLEGGVNMQRGRQTIESEAGRIVAFDCGDVLNSINSDFDLLTLFIPRRRMAPLLHRPDSVHGVCPDVESGAGRMLISFYLDLYLNAPRLVERDAKVMADTIVTLVAQAMNSAAPRDLSLDDAVEMSRLRACTFVRSHLDNPRLDEAAVAAACGISETEVARLFEPAGGFPAFLREQRLRHAAACLMDGRKPSLAWLDGGNGFGSEDFFTAFRSRFGCNPEDIGTGAAPIGRPDRETLDPLCGDRSYEDWIVCLA